MLIIVISNEMFKSTYPPPINNFGLNNLTKLRGERIKKKKEKKKSFYTVNNSRDKWPRGRTLISLRSQFSRLTDYAEVAVEYNFRLWTRPNSIWSDPRERGNGLARSCTIRVRSCTIHRRFRCDVAETSYYVVPPRLPSCSRYACPPHMNKW